VVGNLARVGHSSEQLFEVLAVAKGIQVLALFHVAGVIEVSSLPAKRVPAE
jgi:hypothetical protein